MCDSVGFVNGDSDLGVLCPVGGYVRSPYSRSLSYNALTAANVDESLREITEIYLMSECSVFACLLEPHFIGHVVYY